MPTADAAEAGGRRGPLLLLAVLAPGLLVTTAGCGSTTSGADSAGGAAPALSSPADPSAVPAEVRDAVAACQENPRTRGDLTRGEGVVPLTTPSGSAGSPESLGGADPLEAAEGILGGSVLGARVDGAPVLVDRDESTAVVAVLRDEGPDVDGVLSLARGDQGWQVRQLLTCR